MSWKQLSEETDIIKDGHFSQGPSSKSILVIKGPFKSKEFVKFLSGLGNKHTTSSPGYPHSNGFIECHIQMVKNMLSKSSNAWSFQEVLADLRTTHTGTSLPWPAEILHGRNLTTKAQAEIDINAICSLLQERQLKMMLVHDLSRRAKKARPLVVGERCYVLEPKNLWIDAFVTGITDSGRSYDTEVDATGGHLMRNCSHIRPRSADIPQIHASFLQHNSVPSGTTGRMHHLREKTRSFQDQSSWLRIAKGRSFQNHVREVSNKPIHLKS